MFYVIGILVGISSSSAMTLCANVVLQTRYSTKKAASIIGFIMAGSGIGGVFFSGILPRVLNHYGWRAGYRTLSISWIIILLISLVALGRNLADKHESDGEQSLSGITRAEAIRSPMLYLLLVMVVFLTCGAGLIQHLPTVLKNNGFDEVQLSALMGYLNLVLALGKILQGILYSKVGLIKGSLITYAMHIVGIRRFIHHSSVVQLWAFCLSGGN